LKAKEVSTPEKLNSYLETIKSVNKGEIISSNGEETLTIHEWNSTAESLLNKCPFEQLRKVDTIKKFLNEHKDGSVVITLGPASLKVCMKQKSGASSSFSGTWG